MATTIVPGSRRPGPVRSVKMSVPEKVSHRGGVPRNDAHPRVRTAAKQSSKRVQDVAYRAQVAFAELALTVTMLTFADV
jgi:hypothetical protein